MPSLNATDHKIKDKTSLLLDYCSSVAKYLCFYGHSHFFSNREKEFFTLYATGLYYI